MTPKALSCRDTADAVCTRTLLASGAVVCTLLATLLAVYAPRTCSATPALVADFTSLLAAAAAGGTYSVIADISWPLLSPASVTVAPGTTLTLVGDTTLCGGRCVLDANYTSGHFMVHGATLSLSNLNITHGVKGTSPFSPDYPTPEGCSDLAYSGSVACGTVTVLGGSLVASNVVWDTNVATTDASISPVGAALTFFANETAGRLLVSDSVFSGNRVAQFVVGSGYWSSAFGGAVALWENGGDLPVRTKVAPAQLEPFRFTNVVFSSNEVYGNGGAIFSVLTHAWLILDGCTFDANLAKVNTGNSGRGGALYTAGTEFVAGYLLEPDFPTFANHSHIFVQNCIFSKNGAPTPNDFHNGLPPSGHGGAICFDSFPYSITVANTSFIGNTAYLGGAVYYHGVGSIGYEQLADAGFTDYSSTDAVFHVFPFDPISQTGPDIVLVSSSDYVSLAPFAAVTGYNLRITNSSFIDNIASSNSPVTAGMAGGAMNVVCGEVLIDSSSFTTNSVLDASGSCGGLGGAISVQANACPVLGGVISSRVNATNTLFDGNTALQGSSIAVLNVSGFAGSSFIGLHGSQFSNAAASCATQRGGGLYVNSRTTVDSAGTTYAGLQATNGSAIYLMGDADLISTGDVFSENQALFGAAVYAAGLSVSITTPLLTDNTAAVAAGVFLAAGTATPGLAALPTTNTALNYGPSVASLPKSYSLALGSNSLSASSVWSTEVRSGSPLQLSLVMADVFNQAVTYWQDFTLDVTCASMTAFGTATAAACPSGALLGSTHAAYFSGSASLPTLAVSGAVGASFLLAVTLTSPTIPLFGAGGVTRNLTVTVAACRSLETFDASTQRCVCSAGAFLPSGVASCQPCPSGWVSQSAAAACSPCPAGTFALNNVCTSCPLTSTSAPGSAALTDCMCGYGAYPVFAGTSFTCADCPAGALCDTASTGSLVPLAQEGFWHPPNVTSAFYDCMPGLCFAEDGVSSRRHLLGNASAANCREGHTGPVCAICQTGWSYAGPVCERCPENEAFTHWSQARIGGFLFGVFFIFLVASVIVLLKPLLQEHAEDILSARLSVRLKSITGRLSFTAAQRPAALKSAAKAKLIYEYCSVPLRMLVESLQIISRHAITALATHKVRY